ncbi:Mce-associated membrane protein [Marmoricola sp. OAE513]|uniref:J domain-containing protein n=1 Tax=Marmoricola sp. OAE513 TaxID=2817894 RepID=UPI001AE37A46
MATSGPSWYEILGVAPDATPAEIKAAWRDATDKFEPGTNAAQFRMFNEAADVLLDPQRRNAYDAEQAGEERSGTADAAAVAEVVTAAAEEPEAVAAPAPASTAPVPAVEPELTASEPRSGGLVGALAGSTVALLIVGVLLLASLVAVGFVGKHVLDERETASSERRDEKNGAEARAVAATAMTAALSYDYRTIDADREKISAYVAPSFRKEFLATYDLLTKGANGAPGGAIKLKAAQKVEIGETGVIEADAKRARILVFLNTTTTKTGTEAQERAWRIRVTMLHSGDKWLVEDLDIY